MLILVMLPFASGSMHGFYVTNVDADLLRVASIKAPISPTKCALSCYTTSECRLFNYDEISKRCSLYSGRLRLIAKAHGSITGNVLPLYVRDILLRPSKGCVFSQVYVTNA